MPGASADSTVSPGSTASSRRATISISGSSGIQGTLESRKTMDAWVQREGLEIARHAVRELEALVAVSSPSGDVHGAEECAAVCSALLPADAEVERPTCSSPGHAPDLVATLRGTGSRRILLLGHVDTVVAHPHHKPLTPRRRAAARLRRRRHEGRRRAGARRAAGAGRAQRRLRRGGAAARLRRGVAHGALRARRALRRLGRVPLLRGRRADAGRARGRGGAAQGGGNDQGERARARRALRLGAGPRAQRAARARRRRAGRRRPPRARRPGAPDGGADGDARGRGVQHRAGPRRAVLRPARRLRRARSSRCSRRSRATSAGWRSRPS